MAYADELRENQFTFTRHIGHFINYAYASGFNLSGGEWWRNQEVQEYYKKTGTSQVSYGQHQKRLAMDFNIFKDGVMLFPAGQSDEDYQKDLKIAEPLFGYWESLDEKNACGARYKTIRDPYHFSREF